MTGTVVGLAARARTGTIRAEDGSLLVFSAISVLGEFDTLSLGDRVGYDLDRARPRQTVARVFREPGSVGALGKDPAGLPDLRYSGFHQAANIRSYRFDAVALGRSSRQFVVTVDLALLLKHHVGVQEAPALCLRKLETDLREFPGTEQHQLGDADLLAFALSRTAALERKKPRHSFAGRRGSSPPGPSQDRRTL